MSFVCGGFNENDIAFSLACIYQARGTELLWYTAKFSLLKKKSSTSAVPLTKVVKHIVRLRCRCSCKMCSTSAVPLLVISKTSVISS